jgi:hypothetical protein
MKSLYAYTKVRDQHTTYFLQAEKQQELGQLSDGRTVVAVVGEIASEQFSQLTDIAKLNLTDALRNEIKRFRAFTLIDEQTVAAIRAKYSADDEMKLLRLRQEPEWTDYNDFVEACRAEGKAKKAEFGL